MLSLLSFFTRIPLGRFESIEGTAEQIWMLPLVSLITSLPPAVVFKMAPHEISPVLAVLTLYFTTGLIHLDGLADFSDGVMAKGGRDEKIRVMKDVKVGTAGIFSVVMVLLIQVESLRVLDFYHIILAELNSKTSMVLAISTNKPVGDGLGRFFMERFRRGYLLISFVFYLAIVSILSLMSSLSLLSVIPLLTALVVIRISLKNFGGINGDCMGATAEIVRAATLLFFGFLHF